MSGEEERGGGVAGSRVGPVRVTLEQMDEERVGWILERFVASHGREPGVMEEVREVVLHGIVAIQGEPFEAELMPDEMLDETRENLASIDLITTMTWFQKAFPAGPDGLRRLRESYGGPILEQTARVLASASGAPDEATCVRWLGGVLGKYCHALVEAGKADRDPLHAFVSAFGRRIGTNPRATAPQKVMGEAWVVTFAKGMSRRIAESFVEAGRSRVPSGYPPPLPAELDRAAALAAALRPSKGCALLLVGLGLAGSVLGWVV